MIPARQPGGGVWVTLEHKVVRALPPNLALLQGPDGEVGAGDAHRRHMSLTAWQLTMLASIPRLLVSCGQHWGHGREVAARRCLHGVQLLFLGLTVGRAGSQVLCSALARR